MSPINFGESISPSEVKKTVPEEKKEVGKNTNDQNQAISEVKRRIEALNTSTLDPKTYAAYIEELKKFAEEKQLELTMARDTMDKTKLKIIEVTKKSKDSLNEESRKELIEKVKSLQSVIDKWDKNDNSRTLSQNLQRVLSILEKNSKSALTAERIRTNFTGVKDGIPLFADTEKDMRLSQFLILATTDQEKSFGNMNIQPWKKETSERELLTDKFKDSSKYQDFLTSIQKSWYDEVPEFDSIRKYLLGGTPKDIRTLQLALWMPDNDSANGADGILGNRTLQQTRKYLDAKKLEYAKAKQKKESEERLAKNKWTAPYLKYDT